MTSRPELTWRQSDDLALVGSTDRVVILHLGHLERPARILQGSAAAIWHAVDGVRTERAIVETVAQQYDLAPGDVVDDVTRLLRELDLDGLLQDGQKP